MSELPDSKARDEGVGSMMKLDVNGLSERLAQGVQRQAARAGGAASSQVEVREGLRISLSELGRARATSKSDDIDEADLPDNIKVLLKLIRALRQQIADKQAELQAQMVGAGADPRLKQMRVEALRSELSSLQGALGAAQASLLAALKQQHLSDDQRLQASRLAMG